MMNPSLLKKKKMTNPLPLIHPPSSTTFSSLPDEIIVDCLARISKSHYSSLCLVSKSFYSILSSPEIYEARSQMGATEPRLYVCFWLPTSPNYRWFTLSEMNGKSSFVPLRLASSCPSSPLYRNTVAVGSEIYQIGGYVKRSRKVHVLDCRTHTWRRGPNMRVARKRVDCWYLDGKIYVIGDCLYREKNPMKWGEVLDLKTHTWKPLSFPSGEDNCIGVVLFGGRLYVSFRSENNYAYDTKEGRWVKDDPMRFKELEVISSYPPWCHIDKVMFGASFNDKYKWLHSKKWISICGLDDFYRDRPYKGVDDRYTVRLANYGGKLMVVWHTKDYVSCEMRIWCTLISLEKRLTPLGLQIWGKVERSNFVLQLPESYTLFSCVSASV